MGFIMQEAGAVPNFNKAIISFWFRVPQQSIDNCNAVPFDPTAFPLPFRRIIPLVTMGKQGFRHYAEGGKSELVPLYNGIFYGLDPAPPPPVGEIITTEVVIQYCFFGIDGVAFWYPCVTQDTQTYNPDIKVAILAQGPSPSDLNDPSQQIPPYSDSNTVVTTVADLKTFKREPTFIGFGTDGSVQIRFETAAIGDAKNFGFYCSNIARGEARSFAEYYVLPPDDDFCNAFPAGAITTQSDRNVFGTPFNTVQISSTYHWVRYPECPFATIPPVFTYTDASEFLTVTDAVNGYVYNPAVNYPALSFAADTWHHVLVSVDLSKGFESHGDPQDPPVPHPTNYQYMDAIPHLYCAVDDTNYTGSSLSNFWPNDPNDLNAVASENHWLSAGAGPWKGWQGVGSGVDFVTIEPPPSYNNQNPTVPASGNPIGIPAPVEYQDKIFRVEMAEFQMWTGQSLDTGDVNKRRLFIDFKRDKDGNPVVDPKTNMFTMIPVKPSIVAKALGTPTVMFHGVGNWQHGTDTGTLGKPGDFAPTGNIKRYKPDPSISVPRG
jgi:hypothetical protein